MRAGGKGLGLIALGFCSEVREAGATEGGLSAGALSCVCRGAREAGANRRWPEQMRC